MTPSRNTSVATFCVVALLSACAIGPSVSDYPPALSPQGMTVTVRLADVEFPGAELLEVGDSSVLVLTAQRELVRIYYARMRQFAPLHGPVLYRGASPRSRDIAAWRPLSRFPQGLVQAQVDTLLSFYGRQRVDVRR